MDDDDEIEDIEVEVEVPATPWVTHDTVASAMMFAASLSAATAQHFSNLAMFALGQSASDWEDLVRKKFATDTLEDIGKLLEGGDDGTRGTKDAE